MRAIRSFVVLMGVFFFVLALLAPFLTIDVPWAGEVWLFQSIQELSRSFGPVPTLNGAPFTGPDPLVPVLLSTLPFPDLMSLRITGIMLGSLVALGVFIFCSSLWDLSSGVCSALFTMATWGFIATYGTLNPEALPVSLTVLAFLLFSQIYLKELNPWWYLLSYVLLCLAALTGGWVPLAFFLFSVVLFILLDMSPERLLSIKAGYGAVLVGGAMLAVYVAYRLVEGPEFAGTLFSADHEQGFIARAWLWVKFNLPWLLLAVPAWMYSEGPREAGSWRSLLAPKTAYVMGLFVLLLSSRVQEGFALLSVPFGGIIVGYWMSRKFLILQSLQALRTLTAAGTAAVLAATALSLVVAGSVMDFSFDLAHGAVILLFLAFGAVLAWLARKRYTMAIAGVGIAAVFCLSWYAALVLVPASAEKPASFARQLSSLTPLLVFEDDLVMRGYAGYGGSTAVVVGRNMVPVGYQAYLAVTTADLEDLLEDLSSRMRVEPVTSFEAGKTYALIKVSPAPPRRGTGG
ncbi:MAG TPA: hypothetical protein PKM41_03065 [Deltaproteobacteria bacterium]|nr:hypothetical protein [Deltaproteobacteria bacterium]HOI05776.1 hypothetical protein [Deltaproteobacteria bacterium]